MNPENHVQVVYAVIYGNYEPAEVDSLWSTRERADERAAELGEGWTTVNWQVKT